MRKEKFPHNVLFFSRAPLQAAAVVARKNAPGMSSKGGWVQAVQAGASWSGKELLSLRPQPVGPTCIGDGARWGLALPLPPTLASFSLCLIFFPPPPYMGLSPSQHQAPHPFFRVYFWRMYSPPRAHGLPALPCGGTAPSPPFSLTPPTPAPQPGSPPT